jgi:DNA-binding transcriptional regulator YdaS (Cro superfamily)
MTSLGLSRPAVGGWFSGEKKPSPDHAREIESKFGIPRHRLRPDLWDEPTPIKRRRADTETAS